MKERRGVPAFPRIGVRRGLPVLSLTLALVVAALGAQEPAPPDSQGDDVVKLSVELVQVDAVVVDRKGKQVTDLTAADFEVFENGKAQPITDFSFVRLQPAPAVPTRDDRAAPAAPAAPSRPLTADRVRRTIALVVDDLGLGAGDVLPVRKAVRRFVEEQVQPGDLVAILRTSGGAGANQQFTTDKRQLLAAAERVVWDPRSEAPAAAFADVTLTDLSGGRGGKSETVEVTPRGMSDRYQAMRGLNSVSVLRFILEGMRDLPGRKSLVLFSSGLDIEPTKVGDDDKATLRGAVERLADTANRASVVFYSVDARGIVVDPMFGVEGQGWSPTASVSGILQFGPSTSGLKLLARQTGGLYLGNRNRLEGLLEKVMQDQQGYYLIAYVPNRSTFAEDASKARYNDLDVRVKRPGLTVRTRLGYYAYAERAQAAAERSVGSALVSPFAAEGVGLRIRPVFFQDPTDGPILRALIAIDPSTLSFSEEIDGWRLAKIDLATAAFDAIGRPGHVASYNYDIRLDRATYARAQRAGIVYEVTLKVASAGGFQVRAAVRDQASGRVGSAFEYVEVPDLKRARLALSSLVVGGVATAPELREGAFRLAGEPTHPAIRRFRRGQDVAYDFFVYSQRRGSEPSRPFRLETRLFRDGKEVFAGGATEIPGPATDGEPVAVGRSLRLGGELEPGAYVLQVTVTDPTSGKQAAVVSQAVDFEVEK